MNTSSLLVATKLHAPPLRPGYVVRPRLDARLSVGLTAPLTLISAPPGFGKTTLAAAWLAQLTGAAHPGSHHALRPAAAWLTLDNQDNDLVRFWRYTVAAVQTALPEVGRTAAAMLAQPQPPAIETVIAALVNDLDAQPATLVQVFDDYHLVELPAIHASLASLLDHAPATLHVVLLTRADPPLSLARRRVRGGLVEVRAADLAFSAVETEAFLRERMGLALPSAAAALLAERMGGWIAGVQLAALSLPGQPDPATYLAEHVVNDPYISDYLLEEVLQRQPNAVQDFLLRTAVCDRFCAELCAELAAGDGRPQEAVELGELERANLFVAPLDATHTWYHYHPVFAGLLRRRLRRKAGAAGVTALHLRAAHWFAGQGDLVTAVQHALRANDFALVADWLEQRAGRLFADSQLPELVGWLARLPASCAQERPRLAMIAAWATLATGDFRTAEHYLDILEQMLRDGSPARSAADPGLAEIEVTVVRMQVLLLREQYTAARAACMRLVAQLADLAPQQVCLFNTVAALQPVVTYNLAVLHEDAGSSSAAEEAYAVAAALAGRLDNVHLALLCLGRLAQLQHVRGALHAALRTAQEALALAMGGAAVSPLASHVHAQLGQLYYEWNELDRAGAEFQAGADLAQIWHNWEGLAPCVVGLARLRRAAGEVGAAALLEPLLSQYPNLAPSRREELHAWQRLWHSQDGAPHARPSTPDAATANEGDEERLLIESRLLLACGQAEAAQRQLARLADAAAAGMRWQRAAAAHVLLAKAQVLAGHESAALAAVGQALALTEPQQYCRTWLDAGETVHGLLVRWRERYARGVAPADPLLAYVDSLLTAWETASPRIAGAGATGVRRRRQDLGEPLSPRELEVLALLAAGLSNQEIAEQLVVSVATVKTHLAAIYRKLDAANRTQAVMYARQFGLIDPTR